MRFPQDGKHRLSVGLHRPRPERLRAACAVPAPCLPLVRESPSRPLIAPLKTNLTTRATGVDPGIAHSRQGRARGGGGGGVAVWHTSGGTRQ
eukprot:5440034-Pyramimonas_sp.AAC.1